MSAMSPADSQATTSRVWSCSTFKDGIDYLQEEAEMIEDEEKQLEKMIQDCILYIYNLYAVMLAMIPKVSIVSLKLLGKFVPCDVI